VGTLELDAVGLELRSDLRIQRLDSIQA